jgi:hypothetical protein
MDSRVREARFVHGDQGIAAALRDALVLCECGPRVSPCHPTDEDLSVGTPALGYFRILLTGRIRIPGGLSGPRTAGYEVSTRASVGDGPENGPGAAVDHLAKVHGDGEQKNEEEDGEVEKRIQKRA